MRIIRFLFVLKRQWLVCKHKCTSIVFGNDTHFGGKITLLRRAQYSLWCICEDHDCCTAKAVFVLWELLIIFRLLFIEFFLACNNFLIKIYYNNTYKIEIKLKTYLLKINFTTESNFNETSCLLPVEYLVQVIL